MRVKYKIINTVISLLLMQQVPVFVCAQTTDSMALIRQFVNIGNQYKQIPMYTDILIRNSSNYPTSAEDSSESEIQFYISSKGAYQKYGELELIANDSLMLMINTTIHRMIIVSNHQSMKQLLDRYSGTLLQDSSLQRLSAKYSVKQQSEKNNSVVIDLQTRVGAFGTSLPKEQLEMVYNKETTEPIKVTQIKRKLVSIDSAEYTTMLKDPDNKTRLLAPGNAHFFFVKDIVTEFVYKAIAHNDKEILPVNINDRIVKDENGNYVPVKEYENFILTKQD
jgi:hypothetical protein